MAEQLGLEKGMLIQIAKNYAPEMDTPTDFESARSNIEAALRAAAEDRERGKLPSNLDAAVQHVIDRVDQLNAEQRGADAREALADALAQHEQSTLRLLDKTIVQARIDNLPDLAAEAELKKLPLDTPDRAAQFEALRAVQDIWYERGSDKGLNFDLEVAIALARANLTRASSAHETGTARSDLGTALWTLGARETGTSRLEEAVAAYRLSLEERPRDQVPLQWATAQMNLGNALQSLGQRESGTARLEEAVVAYRLSLEERPRDQVPLDWARAQINLGAAFQTLGEREGGTARLEEAVTALRQSLEELPVDQVPLEWARAQMNLGNALAILGARESGTAQLEEAVVAYRLSLEEMPRDQVPFDWARAQHCLSCVELAFFQKTGEPARLDQAMIHACAAEDVYREAGADHYIQWIEGLIAEITAARPD